MSHFEMDDQFWGHHKVKRALRSGAEAIQMWLAIRFYVAINNSGGLVPDEDIDDLDGAPADARKWLMVLVGCGKPLPEGGRGHGLVDKVDGFWSLHDYGDHGLSPEEIEQRKALSRERQRRWREGRIPRQTKQPNAETNAVSNASRNALCDVPDPIRSDPKRSKILSVGVGSKDLTETPRDDASLPLPAPNLGAGQESTAHPIAAAPRGLSQAFDTSHEQPKPLDTKRAPEGNLERVSDPDAQDPESEPRPPVSDKIPTCAKRFASSFDTEAPDEIEFTEEHRIFAKQNGIELAETWLACRDYRRSKRYRSCDWQAEFLSWLRREAKYRREKVSKNGPSKAPRQPSAQGGFSAAFLRAANGTDGK